MGCSFRSSGYIKRTEECCKESRTINASGSPRRAAKTKDNPAGLNRRAARLPSYFLRIAMKNRAASPPVPSKTWCGS
jgi:hypothetical protein